MGSREVKSRREIIFLEVGASDKAGGRGCREEGVLP